MAGGDSARQRVQGAIGRTDDNGRRPFPVRHGRLDCPPTDLLVRDCARPRRQQRHRPRPSTGCQSAASRPFAAIYQRHRSASRRAPQSLARWRRHEFEWRTHMRPGTELTTYQWNGAEPALPESNLPQLVNILRRRRRSILAIALAGTALVFLVSAMIPPQYTAKAQIVFDPQTTDLGDGRQSSGAAETEAVVQTDITALTSRPFLQRVLDNLSQDPEFRAAAKP